LITKAGVMIFSGFNFYGWKIAAFSYTPFDTIAS